MKFTGGKEQYKYQMLKKHLTDRIRTGAYGSGGKIDSEPSLSERFGLSRNTIRQAVKELETEGYLYRIRGKGTFVRDNSPHNSKKIALLIYDTSYMTHPVTANLIRGTDSVLCGKGFALDILAGKRSFQEEQIARLKESYAGFLIGAYQIDPLILRELFRSGRPCLFVKNYLEEFRGSAVRIDFERAGFLAAEHLIQSGCRELGMIYAGEEIAISGEFAGGVRMAALEYGVRMKRENCIVLPFTDPGSARGAAGHFPARNVDGIVCSTDEFALELLREFRRTGISVPDRIRITGCNNIPEAAAENPGLTTVEIPSFELGKIAAETLLERIGGNPVPVPEKTAPVLIRRGSTGNPGCFGKE